MASERSLSQGGPIYIVVGAYGGVGTALVARLHARGAHQVLFGKDLDKLTQLASEYNCDCMVADATKFDDMSECVSGVLAEYGRIDGIVNLAGSMLLRPAHLTSESDWHATIETNLTSAFATIRAGAKAMIQSGGSIVLVSSVAAKLGLPNHEALAAAKAGVEGLVRSAAATYARRGIRVNCVAPGILDTQLTRNVTASPTQLSAVLETYAISRVGTADEVAAVIEWLLGDSSEWVTGQSIAVDGGLSSVSPVRLKRNEAVVESVAGS